MKAYLLIFAPVFLLLCWTETSSSDSLDMVPEAVDDMYNNCIQDMEKKVNSKYFKKEFVGNFKLAWEKCSNIDENPGHQALTKNHIQAICVYTSKTTKIYRDFNIAVRKNRTIYGSSFPFHSLHFWLTTAMQTLNKKHDCQITYRKTKRVFTGKVKDIIRFGFFASSSKTTNLTDFGSKTCFKIKTCLGADLEPYSVSPEEEEVLIPPYETFTITNIAGGDTFPDLSECKVVIVLESEGNKSELNCKAAH